MKITVCIPTYNRPDELKKALNSVLAQSYTDFEMIIADNASSNAQVQDIGLEYSLRDPRIKYIRHDSNIGACKNYLFLETMVQTDYFIWLGDDDYWSSNHLESLVLKMDDDLVMVFPDVRLVDSAGLITSSGLKRIYSGCVSDLDFLDSWSKHGAGYPFYGLYNLKNFYKSGLKFEFEDDLAYYNEGIFLHKLFLNGKVRFCENGELFYSTSSKRLQNLHLLSSYFDYTKRVSLLYLENESLNVCFKEIVFQRILSNHFTYMFNLCGFSKTSLQILHEPMKFKSFLRFIFILVKSYLKGLKMQFGCKFFKNPYQ
jgi:glycosyltransferase involved in cell wall biosynthesis